MASHSFLYDCTRSIGLALHLRCNWSVKNLIRKQNKWLLIHHLISYCCRATSIKLNLPLSPRNCYISNFVKTVQGRTVSSPAWLSFCTQSKKLRKDKMLDLLAEGDIYWGIKRLYLLSNFLFQCKTSNKWAQTTGSCLLYLTEYYIHKVFQDILPITRLYIYIYIKKNIE